MRTMQLAPPRRRTRRTVPTRHGGMPDLRRTVRESMRLHGEPVLLHRRRRRLRTRRLTPPLDVSGSMADYSRNLVQFAHTSTRASARVEVFCFGTRLTRITRELQHRRPDLALDRRRCRGDRLGGRDPDRLLVRPVRTTAGPGAASPAGGSS